MLTGVLAATVLACLVVGYQFGRHVDSDYVNAVRIAAFNERLTTLRIMRENKMPKETMESMELSAVIYLDSIALDTNGPDSGYLLRVAGQRLTAYVQDFPDSLLATRKDLKVGQLLTLARK